MIRVDSSGNFKNTAKSLERLAKGDQYSILDRFGQNGVDALASVTPMRTGLTAVNWGYRIINSSAGPSIEWYNLNTNDGVNVAIILQYGHATGTGGYVQGIDYINPVIQKVFDDILVEFMSEVSK